MGSETMRAKMLRKALDEYDEIIRCYRRMLACYRTGNHGPVDAILTKLEQLDEREARKNIEVLLTEFKPETSNV